jgi:hypothetical protein
LRIATVAWFMGGGLCVLLMWMNWMSNPVDDVDRAPSLQLFLASLCVWLVVGAGGWLWLRRDTTR